MPGWPASSEAIRRPLVMTVSWLQPPRALRWRATDSAVVLASMTMLSPSWTRAAAGGADRAFSSACRRSRMSNASSGRLRSTAIAPPWVRTTRPSASSDDEVLADGHRRDAELGRQVGDAGAAVLLDDPGDVLLPLAGEDVARRGAGWNGHALLMRPCGGRADGVSIGFGGTVDLARTQCQEGN